MVFCYTYNEIKGLPDQWIDWVKQTVRGGNVGIKVNDHMGP